MELDNFQDENTKAESRQRNTPADYVRQINSTAENTGHVNRFAECKDARHQQGLDEVSKQESNTGPKSPFENGYHLPLKPKFLQTFQIGLKNIRKSILTPIGFLTIFYGLNIVAWGGMLFLLMCNASPAMCEPSCNNIMSSRRIWIEVDSQILNALFCVTAFGFSPWRFRDLYYLLQYRICENQESLRRLAGIKRGWFRLERSTEIPGQIGPAEIEKDTQGVMHDAVPYPTVKIPDPPLTGNRAPPTAVWKLDIVIWAMVLNTLSQAVLCGFMWGMNRFDRPLWSTGTFVTLAFIAAGLGGALAAKEGKNVKSIEGEPVSKEDMERLQRDKELGITLLWAK